MEDIQSLLLDYVKALGYDGVAARLYTALLQYGPTTISELARIADVERSKIYRLLQPMEDSGLVEIVLRQKRRLLKATDIANLLSVVRRRESQLQQMRDDFPKLEDAVAQWQSFSPTRVQFYQGKSGIRQMMLHELNAKTDVLAISYNAYEQIVGSEFFFYWAEEMGRRQVPGRHLFGDAFVESLKTSTERLWGRLVGAQDPNDAERYVPPEVMRITHAVTVYDDAVAHYNWHNGEVYGVEIINQQAADMQRSIFDLIWRNAEPGEAIVRAGLSTPR